MQTALEARGRERSEGCIKLAQQLLQRCEELGLTQRIGDKFRWAIPADRLPAAKP